MLDEKENTQVCEEADLLENPSFTSIANSTKAQTINAKAAINIPNTILNAGLKIDTYHYDQKYILPSLVFLLG